MLPVMVTVAALAGGASSIPSTKATAGRSIFEFILTWASLPLWWEREYAGGVTEPARFCDVWVTGRGARLDVGVGRGFAAAGGASCVSRRCGAPAGAAARPPARPARVVRGAPL